MHLLPEFGARPVEQFGIVLLDTKHRLIRTAVLTVGTPRPQRRPSRGRSSAKPPSARAAGIVLFHNHPSGDPTPSADDVALTRRLVAAGELMGIDVLDHLVLTATRFVSLRETGPARAEQDGSQWTRFSTSIVSRARPATWCSAR
ncbi:MAG: JAB domain-containing protein [Ignavibacteriales bacterium]|nr:JAB domain-containing protein [Ignavibacteriales bacterium]